MLVKMKKALASIGVKLFLSFWLITLASIFITRLVSSQLEHQSIIIPTVQEDIYKLKKYAKRINKKLPKSPLAIIQRAPFPPGMSILIKDTNTQEVFHNHKRDSQTIASFLSKNSYSNLTTVQFPFARLIGPEHIQINQQDYQLFLVVNSKHPHFGSLFMQLPFWVRIIIPLLISLSFCWLLAKTLTRPIIAIKHAATEIGKGNYQARVIDGESRNDELGEMAKSFNQMAEKLTTNIHAHQRLLADVSHELRSPMTRLQIAIGLIESSAEQGKPVDKHISRCEREIGQLDQMISNVLSLSRMENTFQEADFVLLEVTSILKTAIEDAQYLANDKNIRIVNKTKITCQMLLDETQLLSALNNILINAIKHSEEQSDIEVQATISAGRLLITIADTATGVPEEQLPLLFNAFYRVSTARDRETGGTGLGLAIAKQAVAIHQGTISAANNASGGLTITLELPINKAKNV
ncbi:MULTISPECIES: ATP-binding protein [Thalassotalea]|uniref:histidine kinase n=1 Tax=Thalassotalea castellviae TaxID=3075612 RepID=A0ABU3A0R9_9GAMM|nr:ATP-binding protein [Thalassotalea sp. W431]MDT0603777.1 ATP-binding protein [Thalassotalea sp. W431]